jgi:hypothetical protein
MQFSHQDVSSSEAHPQATIIMAEDHSNTNNSMNPNENEKPRMNVVAFGPANSGTLCRSFDT